MSLDSSEPQFSVLLSREKTMCCASYRKPQDAPIIWCSPIFQPSLWPSHPGLSGPCANSSRSSLALALNPLLGTFPPPQFLACVIPSCHSGLSSKGTFQWPSQATHSFLKVISCPDSVLLSSQSLASSQSVCWLTPCLPLPLECELHESRVLSLFTATSLAPRTGPDA